MKRRDFITLSATGLSGLCLPWSCVGSADAKGGKGKRDYSVVILGDTHFDTEPADVYHSNYNEPEEWLNKVQRAEFARNGEMWRDRCPRLLKRAACLIDQDTKMAFQMGDLIQGDCGKREVHTKMLCDVMDSFKTAFGGLPFITVVGNHDIRGVDAEQAYYDFMPKRMSEELGKTITRTTFSFNIGDDAYIVLDFNRPDDAEIESLLAETRGARNTFVITHGPLLPYDGSSPRWFFHGSVKDTEARLHFRKEFAKRNVICLCGHVHRTEFADWYGDGGRITQMTMTSVWSNDGQAIYKETANGAAEYGMLRNSIKAKDNGDPIEDETPLFDEYRAGLKNYSVANSCGSYKLRVVGKNVFIDFYAGDSTFITKTFQVR